MIQLVVAMDLDRTIGKAGQLPWPKHKDDMKRFRALTTGHMVVMGRKTYVSMGSKALPKRDTVVLSRDVAYSIMDGWTLHSHEELPDFVGLGGGEVRNPGEGLVLGSRYPGEVFVNPVRYPGEVFVIGGAEIYAALWPQVQRVHLTVIKGRFEGDVRFPDVSLDDFLVASREDFDEVTETNPVPHRYLVLNRDPTVKDRGAARGLDTRGGQRATWETILTP